MLEHWIFGQGRAVGRKVRIRPYTLSLEFTDTHSSYDKGGRVLGRSSEREQGCCPKCPNTTQKVGAHVGGTPGFKSFAI